MIQLYCSLYPGDDYICHDYIFTCYNEEDDDGDGLIDDADPDCLTSDYEGQPDSTNDVQLVDIDNCGVYGELCVDDALDDYDICNYTCSGKYLEWLLFNLNIKMCRLNSYRY